MNNALKRWVWQMAGAAGIEPYLRLLTSYSALRKSGWFLSAKLNASVDAEGLPIPWMTYPMIHFLAERLHEGLRLFEYGSGNSTLWFATRVGDITSVEHSITWADRIAERIPKTVNFLIRPGNEETYDEICYGRIGADNSYINSVGEGEKHFDIIVIDGVYRNACCVRAIRKLTERGVIIVDNTDYPQLSEGCEYLTAAGFRALHFIGLAPILPTLSKTSVYYRPQNCFNI